MQVLEHPKIQEWLEECRSPQTRRVYESRVKYFFKRTGQSVDDYLQLDSSQKRHVALKFQNENRNENPNTIYGTLSALNSFLDYMDMPINFKGKRIRPRPDLDSHIFSNGDLSKMFDVGNTKQKALLSLATSLGWEVSAVLELDRKTLTQLVARAKTEHQQFIYFNSVRKKTGVLRFGVLNPLVLEWVDKWLVESSTMKPRTRIQNGKTKDRAMSQVFDMTAEGVNKMLRVLAKNAQLTVTGRVHFHKLRGWVMSGLSRAGFNEFQIKYLMGKAIPLSDMTYLQTLQREIEERYPEAYERTLSLKTDVPVKALNSLSKEFEQVKKDYVAQVEALSSKVNSLQHKQAFIDEFTQMLAEDPKKREKFVKFLEKL